MSYALAAEAGAALATALRSAEADSQTLRAGDAFVAFVRALSDMKDQQQARQAVDDAAPSARSDRLAGVSLGDVAHYAESVAAIADAFGAKKALTAALASIRDVADAHAAVDAPSIIAVLNDARADEAARIAEIAEKKREKEEADRRLGAHYAEKLAAAPATQAALAPIVAEMKKRKPALSPIAWREVADRWVRPDSSRTGKAARLAVEAKYRGVLTANHAFGGDRAMAG